MPIQVNTTLNQIRSIAASGDDRVEKARRLADCIRKLGDYHWVGVFDVGANQVSLLAFSGPGLTEVPTFPVGKGLTGVAIKQKQTVNVGDVRKDQRYLTAFGSTVSEIIVPIVDPTGRVVGTVDVESSEPNAFGPSDQRMIEQCGEAALPLWLLG
jgi:L-methionine (R)-S-oxide reductase